VTFLFVNQGETPENVSTFLATTGLSLTHVLFDGTGLLAQRVGSMALPTTLFYDADGRLVGSHLGELSRASLRHALEPFDRATRPPHKETDMRLTALLPLSLALLAAPLQAEELPKAIQQLQAKGAVIKGSFDAPNGLRGYAAEYQNNGMALYLTPTASTCWSAACSTNRARTSAPSRWRNWCTRR
jgi:hypothetical protein